MRLWSVKSPPNRVRLFVCLLVRRSSVRSTLSNQRVPAWAVRACFEACLLLYRSDSFASACRCTGSIELPLGNAREAVLDEALAVFERGEEIQHDVAQEQQVNDLCS